MSAATHQARCPRDDTGWWIIEAAELAGVVSEARRLSWRAAAAPLEVGS